MKDDQIRYRSKRADEDDIEVINLVKTLEKDEYDLDKIPVKNSDRAEPVLSKNEDSYVTYDDVNRWVKDARKSGLKIISVGGSRETKDVIIKLVDRSGKPYGRFSQEDSYGWIAAPSSDISVRAS